MFCSNCGGQIADGARFCAACGSPAATLDNVPAEGSADATLGLPPTTAKPAMPIPPPSPVASAPPPPPFASAPPAPPPPPGPAITPPGPAGAPAGGAYRAGGYGGYGAPPPPKKSRTGLWIGLAAAAVIIIAAAVALPLLLLGDHEDATTTTVTSVPSTTTTRGSETTTTSSASSTTTTASTTTTTVTGAPGDSAGRWAEVDVPVGPEGAYVAVVSDEALLLHTQQGDAFALYAYLFESGTLIELPIEASEFWGADLDGSLAVWWEGDYDQETWESYNEHIYAFRLPDGPKIEIVGGDRHMSYPQVAGSWVTWTEGEPWDMNPEEYWLQHIYAVEVDSGGRPVGEPTEVVSSAPAFALGDSTWVYSLSSTHLAWENAAAHNQFDAGTYVMDLATLEPQKVGGEAWRPSVAGSTVVYWENGLKAADLLTGQVQEIDRSGDFPSAAPTFAAYFRSVESANDIGYEIVTRGHSGGHEQVLGRQSEPPWLSPFIGVSDTRVAFVADGVLRVFEWQGEGR